MRVPATAGADGVEVALHVLGTTACGRLAGQHALEMLSREIVLPFEEECASQFETWPGAIGMEDQNAPQRRDGCVQQSLPGLFIETGRVSTAPMPASPVSKSTSTSSALASSRGRKSLIASRWRPVADERFGILDAGLQRSRHQQKKRRVSPTIVTLMNSVRMWEVRLGGEPGRVISLSRISAESFEVLCFVLEK